MVAVTVNVSEPAAVGVPDTTPVEVFNARPAGRAPADTANVGAGDPDATTVCEYAEPTTAPGSEAVVIDGATAAAVTATV